MSSGQNELRAELLYGRPPRLKVFLSSQMRRRVLEEERLAAVEAIESTGLASAWHWERDAHAGPYSSREVCLGHAHTSDGLVLLVARRITPITRDEYDAASVSGVPRYIFLKQGSRQARETREFVEDQRQRGVVTKGFANLSELKTEITAALLLYAVQAVRRENIRRRSARRSHAGRKPRVTRKLKG